MIAAKSIKLSLLIEVYLYGTPENIKLLKNLTLK
jgi:hypothetical protein